MECTIQSMTDSGQGATGQSHSPVDPATIPSGKVGQVCREWLVREDGVLAYQLQNEEISKHYEGNRNKNQVVRSDLHQAKSLQEYEYHEMMRRYQRELEEQMENDARIAAQIQEQEIRVRDASKSGLQRQESIVERDRLIAERLQAKERVKVLKYKLLKEKRQVERVASGGLSNNGNGTNSPSDNHSNGSNDSNGTGVSRRYRFGHNGNGDIVDTCDLTEFCIKPPEDLTDEEKRIFLEEQDAELARFLQKQEAARNQAKDSTKSVIESHDAEIARILQEQEKAKARKLREKARLRALQRQQREKMSTSVHQPNTHVQSSAHVQSNSSHAKQVQQAAHGPSASHSASASGNQSYPLHNNPTPSSGHHSQYSPSVPSHQSSSHSSSSCCAQSINNGNPLRNSNGSRSSHSPHCINHNNNNHSSGVTSSSHQSSSHCHQSSGLDTFDTIEPDEESAESEIFDDENPIVDRYYPVGDDLKKMNQSRNPGGLDSHGHRPKVTTDVSIVSKNSNFHNIAMDLDPTYKNRTTGNSSSGSSSIGQSGHPGQSSLEQLDINGLHFAQFCRVSPTLSEGQRANGVQQPPVSNLTRTRNRSGEGEVVSINPAILPVPGHRRAEKNKKNKKMADNCKQQ